MVSWRNWYKPNLWRWWWTTAVPYEAKAVVFTVGALTLGIIGYLSATGVTDDEKVVFTEQVVTVTRTTLVKG